MLLGVWGAVSLKAQNNPFRIDDTSYAMYVRANKFRDTDQGLRTADSLYNRAVAMKDGKSQCLALSIFLVHQFVIVNQFDQLDAAAERLKQKAREVNLPQYYYYAIANQVNYYINHNRTLYAMELCDAMRKEAFAENYPYGIFTSIRSMGHVNLGRYNSEAALRNYMEAYEYGSKNCQDQDMAGVLNRIVICLVSLRRYDEAEQYALKAKSIAKTPQLCLSSMVQLGMIYYNLKDEKRFVDTYRQCEEMINQYGDMGTTPFSRLKACYYMISGRTDEAYRVADSLNVPEDRLLYRRMIARYVGDYQQAYELSDRIYVLRDSMYRVVQHSDYVELNLRTDNALLRMEAKDLQLKNTNLKLQNTALDLERANSKIEMDRIAQEKQDLEMRNDELELANLKATTEQQRLLLREKQIEVDHNAQIGRIVFIVTVFLVIFLIILVLLRYRSELVLRKKNAELDAARRTAEQADRIKTVFLQNMSHEIRTPLNAIVGFSQVLCDDDSYGISAAEKADLKSRIIRNSELLTTLVNDILDLSGLESGKYRMDIVPTSCNEMCKSSIQTVTHRCPHGVKLYYTTEVDDAFTIPTDGKRLMQVLINFLTNAEKNTSRGEIHLHCSVSEQPAHVTFSVTDTGKGVPPEMQDAIFERFRKLDSFKQGTGLGLNICTVIAGRLGGRVYLDKHYTRGARFVLALPVEGVKEEYK
jgi:signal transduction histidine kinase